MRKLTCLWIDALRLDHISPKYTPFLYRLHQKKKFQALKPPFGFSSIGAAMFSGQSPDKSGQFMLYGMKNKQTLSTPPIHLVPKKILPSIYHFVRYLNGQDFFFPLISVNQINQFSPAQTHYYHHPHSLKVPTLFNIFDRHKISYLIYNHPLIATSEAKSQLAFFSRSSDIAQINKFVSLEKRQSPQFSLLHLWNLDTISHSHGPESPQVNAHLLRLDGAIEKMTHQLKLKHDNFLLWSDHGMLPVTQHQDLMTLLPSPLKQAKVFLDSTMARFWFTSSKQKKQTVNLLKYLKWGRLLTRTDRRRWHLDLNDKFYGDVIFLAKPGIVISPNYFSDKEKVKGMHGYDLSHKQEWGTLWMNRTARSKPRTVDLFSTILEVFGIKAPQSQGKSLLPK